MVRGVLLSLAACSLMTAFAANPRAFAAENRAIQSASIVLNGDIAKVFPLFGFMEEKKWSHGWDPQLVSGGEPLQDAVFTVSHDGKIATWIVAEWDEQRHRVTYAVFVPNERAMTIRIQCTPEGKNTRAEVTYTLTILGEPGLAALKEFQQQDFAHRLLHWQLAINYYLETGKQWEGDSH